MNTTVAKFLSYLFHPLLMPTYLLAALFYFSPLGTGVDVFPAGSLWVLLLVIFIYTFLIPVLGVYGMIRLGLVEDLTLKKLSQRRFPFLFTVVVYAGATYFFGWRFTQVSEIAPVLRAALGGVTISIALVGIISSGWQISAHATGIGGVTGALLAFLFRVEDPALMPPFLFAVLVSGWVTASRLKLNAHTMNEVSAGYVLGALVCGNSILLFL